MKEFASWLPWPSFSGVTERNDTQTRRLTNQMREDKPGKWKLKELESLHPLFQQDRIQFNRLVAKFLQEHPDFAREPHFFVPYLEEYLLFRMLCYKPPFHLVQLVYSLYPPALYEPNAYHRSALHRACQFQASTAVIQWLLDKQPEAPMIEPSPLFLSIHPGTHPDSIELLIKAYPTALVTSYDGDYTALDQAFNEGLAPSVVSTMIQHYPKSVLDLNMISGSPMISPEVAVILTSNHPKIRVLNISHMRLSQAAFEWAWIKLASNTTLLEFIQDISSIERNSQSLSESLQCMLATNTHMKKLSFVNGIKSHALGLAVLEGLAQNDSLQDLCFHQGLNEKSVHSLIDLVSHKPNISTFTLTETSIGTSTAISSLVHLQHLDLSNCDSGPPLAAPLAALLEASNNLRVLRVANNRISSEGTIIIANALKRNASVVEIDYRGNNIGQKGWFAVVKVLRDSNYTIQEFRLSDQEETVFEDYYCSLNRAGRKHASDATIEDFVELLVNTPSFDMQHGLLRHVPHIWCSNISEFQ